MSTSTFSLTATPPGHLAGVAGHATIRVIPIANRNCCSAECPSAQIRAEARDSYSAFPKNHLAHKLTFIPTARPLASQP
jgi:hypothetical protein